MTQYIITAQNVGTGGNNAVLKERQCITLA